MAAATSTGDQAKLKEQWQAVLPPFALTNDSLDEVYSKCMGIFALAVAAKKGVNQRIADNAESIKSYKRSANLHLKSKIATVQKMVKGLFHKYLETALDLESVHKGAGGPSPKINLGSDWDLKMNKIFLFMLELGEPGIGEEHLEQCHLEIEADDLWKNHLADLLKERETENKKLSIVSQSLKENSENRSTDIKVIKERMKKDKLPFTWTGKNAGFFSSLTLVPMKVQVDKKNINGIIEDIAFIDNLAAMVIRKSEEFVLNDPKFALIKQCQKLSQLDRVKQPNYGPTKAEFDQEVMKVYSDRFNLLATRIKAIIDETPEANTFTKTYLVPILIYLERNARDLKFFGVPPAKEKVTATMADQVIAKLGKEQLTKENVDQFGDFFTGLPVRKGAAQRKELALKILKDGTYSSEYKAGLLVEDRFGNTLYSMAISGLPEAERAKFQNGQVVPLREKELAARKLWDLRATLKADLQARKSRKEETIVDGPISRFLKDPSRELLRIQLKCEGASISYRARYPKNPAEQEAYYRSVVAKFGSHIQHFLKHILAEEIDYSNTNWMPVFLPIFKQHGYLGKNVRLCNGIEENTWNIWLKSSKEIDKNFAFKKDAYRRYLKRCKGMTNRESTANKYLCSRLISSIIDPVLFSRIIYKVVRISQKVPEDEFKNTSFGKQIRELFQVSFNAFKVLSEVMETKEFKYDDPAKSEGMLDANSTYAHLYHFVRRELSRHLLLYHTIFRETPFVQSIVSQAETVLQEISPPNNSRFGEYLACHSTFGLFEILPDIAGKHASREEVSYMIAKKVAFRIGFENPRVRSGACLGLLYHGCKPYEEADLAECAMKVWKHRYMKEIVKMAAKFNPMNVKQSIMLLLNATTVLEEFEPSFKRDTWVRENLTAWLNTPQVKIVSILDESMAFKSDSIMQKTQYLDQEVNLEAMVKYSKRAARVFDKKVNSKTVSFTLNFCRQALEVLAVYYQGEQSNEPLVTLVLQILLEAIGSGQVVQVIFKFVAKNYLKGSAKMQAFCAFLINKSVKYHVESGIVFPDKLGFEKEWDYQKKKEPPTQWTSLVYNRFIDTATKKGWVDEAVKAQRLLTPIVADIKDASRLTQQQLFNIVLLADHCHFRQVALSTGLTEDEKLMVMGVKDSLENPSVKAELLKLLKVPGMTRHCIRYLGWIESFDVHGPSIQNIKDTMKAIVKLNDYDYDKMVQAFWAFYKQEKSENCLKILLLHGMTSGSVSKLCTVLRLSGGNLLSVNDLEAPILQSIFDKDINPEEQSTMMAINSKWEALGKLLSTPLITQKITHPSLKLVENITEATLVDLLNNGQAFFRSHFLAIRDPIDKILLANQKVESMSPLTADLPQLLVTMLNNFCKDYDFQKNQSLIQFCDPEFLKIAKIDKKEGPICEKSPVSEKDRPKTKYLVPIKFSEREYFKAIPQVPGGGTFIQRIIHHYIAEDKLHEFEDTSSWDQKKISPAQMFNLIENFGKTAMMKFRDKVLAVFLKSNDIEILAEYFNYSLTEGIKGTFTATIIEKTVMFLMISYAPTVEHICELASRIKDHRKFISAVKEELAIFKAVSLQPVQVQAERFEDESEKENSADDVVVAHQGFVRASFDSFIFLSLVYTCFVPDSSVAQDLMENLKGMLDTSRMETLFRMINLNQDIISKQKGRFNQEAFQKVKTFVQSGGSQSEGPLNKIHPTSYSGKILDFLVLLEIARESEAKLATDPTPISEKWFQIGDSKHKATFSPALVKQIFSDQKLAITKLCKAGTALQRALLNTKQLSPLSMYGPEDDVTLLGSSNTIFNPFDVKTASVTICTKEEIPKGSTDPSPQFFLPVWFDVVEEKKEKSQADPDYLVKVQYHVYLVQANRVYFFDPKARHHQSLFDLVSLKASLEDQITETENKLGPEILEKYQSAKLGAFSGSVLDVQNTNQRRFFGTNFGENFIGFSQHNERYIKKKKALAATKAIIADCKKGMLVSNTPKNVAEKVNALVGTANLTGKGAKCASYLTMWDASINNV